MKKIQPLVVEFYCLLFNSFFSLCHLRRFLSLTDKVTAKYPTAGSHYEVRAGKLRGRVAMFCNTTGHPIISRTWFYNGIEIQKRLHCLKLNIPFIT